MAPKMTARMPRTMPMPTTAVRKPTMPQMREATARPWRLGAPVVD
jgi:hypothetical protein